MELKAFVSKFQGTACLGKGRILGIRVHSCVSLVRSLTAPSLFLMFLLPGLENKAFQSQSFRDAFGPRAQCILSDLCNVFYNFPHARHHLYALSSGYFQIES